MTFIPALQYHVLTPGYDVLIRLTFPEFRFKRHLISAATITAGQRVLDVGCGTGTLLVLAANCHPDAMFYGLDPDPRILDRARWKIARTRHSIALQQASATAMPFEPENFDRVLSTLAFHHLTCDEKLAAAREILRVLRAGGELHLGDFGQPDTRAMRLVSYLTAKIGHEHVEENFAGMLPSMLEDAGFVNVVETGRFTSIFGALRTIRAVKPA